MVDGFESFEHSQYYPFHANLAVGAESHFLYAFSDAELRRKGRMTPFQKAKRARLEARFGRPDPRAIEHAVAALVRMLATTGVRTSRSSRTSTAPTPAHSAASRAHPSATG